MPPFGGQIDYLTFGGLYRQVWLLVRENSHFKDVFVRAEMDGMMEIQIRGVHTENTVIRGHVLDREKKEAAAISERPFADKIVLKPENIKPWTLSQP